MLTMLLTTPQNDLGAVTSGVPPFDPTTDPYALSTTGPEEQQLAQSVAHMLDQDAGIAALLVSRVHVVVVHVVTITERFFLCEQAGLFFSLSKIQAVHFAAQAKSEAKN